MPRRLQRKGYGWSLTYGREQRTVTEQFKTNYERIKWHEDNPEEWEEGRNLFGKCKVKRFI